MRYKNIRNGAVIDINCKLTDVDWAEEPSTQSSPDAKPKPKGRKKTE